MCLRARSIPASSTDFQNLSNQSLILAPIETSLTKIVDLDPMLNFCYRSWGLVYDELL